MERSLNIKYHSKFNHSMADYHPTAYKLFLQEHEAHFCSKFKNNTSLNVKKIIKNMG